MRTNKATKRGALGKLQMRRTDTKWGSVKMNGDGAWRMKGELGTEKGRTRNGGTRERGEEHESGGKKAKDERKSWKQQRNRGRTTDAAGEG